MQFILNNKHYSTESIRHETILNLGMYYNNQINKYIHIIDNFVLFVFVCK